MLKSKKKKNADTLKLIASIITDKNFASDKNTGLWNIVQKETDRYVRQTASSWIVTTEEFLETVYMAGFQKRTVLVVSSAANSAKITEPEQVKDGKISTVSSDFLGNIASWYTAGRMSVQKVFFLVDAATASALMPEMDYIHLTKMLTMSLGEHKTDEEKILQFANMDFEEGWKLILAEDIQEHNGIKYQSRRYQNMAKFRKKTKQAKTLDVFVTAFTRG